MTESLFDSKERERRYKEVQYKLDIYCTDQEQLRFGITNVDYVGIRYFQAELSFFD